MTFPHSRRFGVLLTLLASIIVTSAAIAQPRPEGRKGLPQQHEYQKALRAFLTTLTEKDFEPPQGKKIEIARDMDADEQFRTFVLSLDPVRIGAKRSAPSVNLPSKQFLLRSGFKRWPGSYSSCR